MGDSNKTPGVDLVRSIVETCERGMMLDAFRQAEAFAPLQDWSGIEACGVAHRIASNIGAARLGSRLAIRAWRTDREHPVAQFQYALELSEKRGPLAVWRAMRDWKLRPDATKEQRAELLAIKARAAGDLRDFAVAEPLLAEAESLKPDYAWIRLQRASLLEWQDQPEAALDAARKARALHPHPFHRPSVQTEAHLLQVLDRDDEAIELLTAADAHIQSAPVAVQLYALLSENGHWHKASNALDRYLALSPLIEPRVLKWVSSQRARVNYHLGERAAAVQCLGDLDDPFHKAFAAALAVPNSEPVRVQLDVTFVRQHFKTCAPATLAALGRFWKMPSEHLKMAEAMCYDGTPSWQQRDWAEKNGWHVREFRVTHEVAIALVLKGVPFAVSTVEATSAHMQAVTGFDPVRSTLLLRDPSQPYTVEVVAADFFKRYRPFGPRGMVFVPSSQASLLDGMDLPDTDIHDNYHELWLALSKHDRPRAAETLKRMNDRFPEHELTWEARFDIAAYDQNDVVQRRCIEKLLELFPNSPAHQRRLLYCLRNEPRQKRVEFLQTVCEAKESDPALYVELARAHEGDARQSMQRTHWLRRAMRYRPVDSTVISVLANLLWDEGRWDEATELYRFAANLETFQEQHYQSWFIACRRTRRTEAALSHLRDRFDRFGTRSDRPALTLAWALRETEQPVAARDVLLEAMRLRPEDGYLALRAAAVLADLGCTKESDRLLASATTKVRQGDWLRAAAEIAENRGDDVAALRWAGEILKHEPLALDAHGGTARALAKREGATAAIQHLRQACGRFPEHFGLQRMLVDWARTGSPESAESAARSLVAIEPSDAWARRELALALMRLNRSEEALQHALESVRIEPQNSYSHSILGHIHHELRQLPEAKAAFRRAVETSVDNGDAISLLLQLACNDSERMTELAFVEAELVRQVVHGDGLLAFLESARPILNPEALLAGLRKAHKERPDLWHAWSALVSQLGHLGRLDEALDLAHQATQRFAHLPKLWLDLADVHQWRNEPDKELAAAERAFEMNPSWSRATVALASVHERRGRLEEASRIYERGLSHLPNDAMLHAYHASLLWRLKQVQKAFVAIERALRIAPGYDWAWGLLNGWAHESGQTGRTAGFSRQLAAERPGDMRVWLFVARFSTEQDTGERIAAVDRALTLDPRSTEAWDFKAELLALAERFDEAIKACADGAAACSTDLFILRGRHAWIEAQRRKFDEAIRLMRAALVDNASYAWGWNQLAIWLTETNNVEEAVVAAQNIIRLRPHDAWGHTRLGFLLLKKKDTLGAKRCFTTALTISPTESTAAENLFDLQLADNDLSAAAQTLQLMQTHLPGTRTLAAEVFLKLRTGETDAALNAFKAICTSHDSDGWPVQSSADALKRAGQMNRALKIAKSVSVQSSANPQLAAAVVELLMSTNQGIEAAWFFLRLKQGEARRRAADPLIHGLANSDARLTLRLLLWRRRAVFAQDDTAWARAGYAMVKFGWNRSAVEWQKDWRQRPNVQPYALFNQCLALRQLGRNAEATEVANHALKMWPHREGTQDLRLFLAVEEALAGNVAAANEHLRLVTTRRDVNYDQHLMTLANLLVQWHQTPVQDRKTRFKEVRETLKKTFTPVILANSLGDVRLTFKRAGKIFAKDAGFKATLWFWWKLNNIAPRR